MVGQGDLGGQVPAEGDTAVIGEGVTVTVSDARAIGASGEAGEAAMELGKSGAIFVAKGGILRVRGDVVYAAGATATGVTVEGGGTWRWDASKAAAPLETSYVYHPLTGLGYRAFVLEGSERERAVLDSDAGGGAGRFGRDAKTAGGPFRARFADITRIGGCEDGGVGYFLGSLMGPVRGKRAWGELGRAG